MNPLTILQLILLAEQGVTPLLNFIAQLKAQAGISDADLLSLAEQTDAATRAKVEAFLAKLPAV